MDGIGLFGEVGLPGKPMAVGSRFYFTCMMDVPDEIKHNGVQEDEMNQKGESIAVQKRST